MSSKSRERDADDNFLMVTRIWLEVNLIPGFCRAENGSMYLRAYRAADFGALYALDRACFEPPFRFSRAVMRQVVGAPGAVVLLACEAGEGGAESLLGFCAAQVEEVEEGQRYAYVATLDVALEARGRGVGRTLMLAVEDQARQSGAGVMVLHVFVGNAGAVALYERLGYARLGREREFYGAGLDGWAYRKELKG